jgi:hypothetical protein
LILHLLLTVVRTLVTEHNVERFFIAGVHQYVEDELVELGNALRADVSRAKLVKDGFGEVHSIHRWGETSDCSEDNRSEIDQELRKRHARSSVGKVHLPCEGSTSDPYKVNRRLDAVDLVEENTMCSCHVAICRDRLLIVLARPCVVHDCPVVKRFW